MANFDLDEHIKNRFHLFSGERPTEVDEKLYDKIYDLCIKETIAFVSEHSTPQEMNEFSEKLKSEDPKTTFSQAMNHIPQAKPLLEKRLGYFVDQLLLNSLEGVNNKNV